MRYLILPLLIVMLLTGCSLTGVEKVSPEQIQKITQDVNNSKLIILDVYHNRCESCKLIEPIIEKLKSSYAQDPNIVFLKYDLSNPFTIYNSRKIAKEIGLERIYKSQRYSGVVLLIDSNSRQVTDTLIGEYNIEKYTGAIEKRLKRSA